MKRYWTLLLLLALGVGGAVSAVHAGHQMPQGTATHALGQDDCHDRSGQGENGQSKASALCHGICHAPMMAFGEVPAFQAVKRSLIETAVVAPSAALVVLNTPGVPKQPPRLR